MLCKYVYWRIWRIYKCPLTYLHMSIDVFAHAVSIGYCTYALQICLLTYLTYLQMSFDVFTYVYWRICTCGFDRILHICSANMSIDVFTNVLWRIYVFARAVSTGFVKSIILSMRFGFRFDMLHMRRGWIVSVVNWNEREKSLHIVNQKIGWVFHCLRWVLFVVGGENSDDKTWW